MVTAFDEASAPYRSDFAFVGVLALSIRQPLVSLVLAVVASGLHLPWMSACKGASLVAFFLSGYNYSVPFGLLLSPLGLIANHLQSDAGRTDGCRRERRAVNQRPTSIDEIIDHNPRTGHKPTLAPDRFAQRSDTNRNSIFDGQGLAYAAAAVAEDTRGMRLVDNHARIIPLGDITDLDQGRDMAVHAEDSVSHNNLQPGMSGYR